MMDGYLKLQEEDDIEMEKSLEEILNSRKSIKDFTAISVFEHPRTRTYRTIKKGHLYKQVRGSLYYIINFLCRNLYFEYFMSPGTYNKQLEKEIFRVNQKIIMLFH